MIEQSTDINELAGALAVARNNMQSVGKGTKAHYGNYADLNAFIDASVEALLDQGLMVTQHPITQFIASTDSQVPPVLLIGCETLIMHDSGQWQKSQLLLPCMDLSPQQAGGVITYSRRYALQAILLLPAKDDDAQSAQDATKKIQAAAKTPAHIVGKTAPKASISVLNFDDIGKQIGSAINEAALNDIYGYHIKVNTNLTPEQKTTLTAQCKTRKEAIKGAK